MQSITENTSLRNEVELLCLIYHRNKNQHRLLNWWKYFRLLINNLKRLCMGLITIDAFMSKRLLIKCYYEFNGIIKLGQFINLGFVLVSILARVHNILSLYHKPEITVPSHRMDIHIDEDVGQEITLQEPTKSNETPKPDQQIKKRKSTSIARIFGKKKKKKSDIDKLFK